MSIRDLSSSGIREWIAERPLSKASLLKSWQGIDRAVLIRRVLLILVGFVAVGIRLWGINQIGFNTDEAVYSGQAATIAGVPTLKDIFPAFRAHPLLFQYLLSLLFATFGVSDLAARLLAVGLGLVTIYMVYRLGSLLYGENVGLLAALILAVVPYHVIVSRQVLLDGPLLFCITLTFYLLARFALTEHPAWLHAVGVGMGLTFLAKETGIILLGAIYSFLALSGEIQVRLKDLAIAFGLMILTVLPFPISLWLAGGSKIGKQYLIWQLFRRPNHTWDFYLVNIPQVIGILVIILAVLGLWFLRHERTWRERLLIWWVLVPIAFFQIWPTKGFQYLLPIVPAFAILASRTLIQWKPSLELTSLRQRLSAAWSDQSTGGIKIPIGFITNGKNIEPVRSHKSHRRKKSSSRSRMGAKQAREKMITPGPQQNPAWLRGLAIGITVLSLFVSSWQRIQPSVTGTFTAGTGGVPGGRETGQWVKDNIPAAATMLTIGPSMANILQFYGYRQAYGLSVSPNSLYRNPAYEPVKNPPFEIQMNNIQFLVWDAYSAERSSFFSKKILQLVTRFNGRVVHTQSVIVTLDDGSTVEKPVVVIYEVHP